MNFLSEENVLGRNRIYLCRLQLATFSPRCSATSTRSSTFTCPSLLTSVLGSDGGFCPRFCPTSTRSRMLTIPSLLISPSGPTPSAVISQICPMCPSHNLDFPQGLLPIPATQFHPQTQKERHWHLPNRVYL